MQTCAVIKSVLCLCHSQSIAIHCFYQCFAPMPILTFPLCASIIDAKYQNQSTKQWIIYYALPRQRKFCTFNAANDNGMIE